MKTVFEKSQPSHRAFSLPKNEEVWSRYHPPEKLRRQADLPLPEISELDLTRHFAEVAGRNVGIDNLFYPLGSCTMKLNPRVNEHCASLPQFTCTHPLAPDHLVQANLEVIFSLTQFLCELCGMAAGSLVPNAGAQGEFVGMRMIASYHKKKGELERNQVLVPDNAHGTNPATAAMCGFQIISLKTDEQGEISLEELQENCSKKTAALMLTNPNTLGIFSSNILEIAQIVHESGALLYYDGANLNPIMGIAKPADMGFDVIHLNLHKTFSTPHGGGGPGSGPVLCNQKLSPFLPDPTVIKKGDLYATRWENEGSIGFIASFHGNFGIYLRAYVYCLLHGMYGLRRIAEQSVLNANYLKKKVESIFHVPFSRHCMHEFVVQADRFLNQGIKALDIAKRMLDYGVHPPTVYFPLIIKECFLIEPTECESKQTLDRFIEILEMIAEECQKTPEKIKQAPHTTCVTRLDEVRAVRSPILKSHLQNSSSVDF